METTFILWSIIACFILGAFFPLVTTLLRVKSKVPTVVSLWLALAGSVIIFYYAVQRLVEGNIDHAILFTTDTIPGSSFSFALSVYIDRLAAFFLLLIGGLSIGIAIYSFAYLRAMQDRAQIAGAYNLFVLCGTLFVICENLFFFILLLECTTLAFGALILHKHYAKPDVPGHQQAIKTYLIANHIGGIFLTIALLIFAAYQLPNGHPVPGQTNMYQQTFELHQIVLQHNISVENFVFVLAFIGLGIKAGVVPFHIWVAIAHPSSPTNTHAMSLGIMIKISLYGMIRVFFQFLPNPQQWWGLVVLIIAALTAIVGVRNALYGRTLKDSLADHSVENIGIILASIGLALIFAGSGLTNRDELVGLALAVGLYHLLNHTVFKGLLYLCTGAVDQLTGGVVELNRLGGLIHRFRWTSACFLVGSIAIAGFPPFNGFISEWLTLQILIIGMNALVKQHILLAGIILSLVLLASAFALTAFAFVKIAGEVFLGKARDETVYSNKVAEKAKKDVPWRMRGVMVVFAVLCLALGLLPFPIMTLLGNIVGNLGQLPGQYLPHSVSAASSLGGIILKVPIPSLNSKGYIYVAQIDPALLLILLGLFTCVFFLAVRVSHYKRSKPVWIGGTPYNPATMQSTSSAFTSPVRNFLERAFTDVPIASIKQFPLVKQWIQLIDAQSSATKVPPIKTRFELSEGRSIGEPFRQVYNGVIILLQKLSRSVVGVFQNGDLRYYILYIFVSLFLIFLIVFLISSCA